MCSSTYWWLSAEQKVHVVYSEHCQMNQDQKRQHFLSTCMHVPYQFHSIHHARCSQKCFCGAVMWCGLVYAFMQKLALFLKTRHLGLLSRNLCAALFAEKHVPGTSALHACIPFNTLFVPIITIITGEQYDTVWESHAWRHMPAITVVTCLQVVLETHHISDRVQQITVLLQNQGYMSTCDHTGPLTNCMIYALRDGGRNDCNA